MFEDFFTQPQAERFLLNQKSAVVLGVCTIPSAFLLYLRYCDWNFAPSNHFVAAMIDWTILPLCLGMFALLAGIGLFIFRCGTQPPRDKFLWGLMLIFGFPYTEIAVYFFLYLPTIRARLSGSEQTPLS